MTEVPWVSDSPHKIRRNLLGNWLWRNTEPGIIRHADPFIIFGKDAVTLLPIPRCNERFEIWAGRMRLLLYIPWDF